MSSPRGTRIDRVTTATYEFPTPEPEADGTLTWSATTAVTVTVHAGGRTGLGWTYSSPAAASVIEHHLTSVIRGHDVFDVTGGWQAMRRACRNLGTKGLVMQAISAVDIAWWDLKARLLDTSLVRLFGRNRNDVPIYGSGGFVTYDDRRLAEQVDWWHSVGAAGMKIKIGESRGGNVARDIARVKRLRELAGQEVALMVDANGGYTVGQARRVGAELDALGVVWFEEPVSSDDVAGLGTVRDALRCDVTAGEYAADDYDARALAPVVDCLQLDVTRCGGFTGWLSGAAVAQAHNLQVSGHCAPALHAQVAAAVPNLRHVEWFVDHVRLEPQLVHGCPVTRAGGLHVDPDRPGHGMSLRTDADERRTG
jgi:L-alanine-DL-glutamate epimerase-like enolase superfamily enzyme